ncbi:hypothetical protein B0H11DRAFT_1724975 [Mycena galericulata]|nr:hypothetical protein B0H11DRAFT_1724975 [Mycena galericulata]
MSSKEKLDKIFDLFQEVGWCLGEFMHHTFAHRDVNRSPRHGNIVQRYLSGRNRFNVAEILEAWLTSPDGAGADSDTELYSLTIPYTELMQVRSILTSFAAQTIQTKLVQDIRAALGLSLMRNMKSVVEHTQGLFYQYMIALATPDSPSRHGVVAAPRRNRPPELVCSAAINAIGMITFCRNYHARLLPLARGILYLASHVPIDIIDINCRIGTMPSLETIKASLRGFSEQKAAKIRMMGRDTAVFEQDGRKMVKANIIIFDNSQHFRRQRERRIGRENMMVIGISATFIQFLVDAAACDPLDRRRQIKLNLRRNITVETLLSFIDFPHLRNVGILQFLSALATYIPEAAEHKSEIHLRYRTRCKKRQLPLKKSDMHTLASSGKNEAIIPELKDALLDFQQQLGQTEDDYDFKLWFGGGDGMSYNNMLLVKKYLQNHTESPFQSFELMIPVLQVWHTLWTDLCRIYETHWGGSLNDNPATLGNSAKKIGRPPPANLSKVDYYPAAELLALVHDMRILDCWCVHFKCDDLHVYFRNLADTKSLPSFEDLEIIAKQLYDTHTGMAAQTEALYDARDGKSSWTSKVPLGTPWVPVAVDTTSAAVPRRKRRSKKAQTDKPEKTKAPKSNEPPPIFYGDAVFSDSVYFMRDASISREAAAAVAEGSVGRLYEALKIMLSNFAGSSHSRYMGYLLEMICHIEQESNPELAAATLDSLICNPSGKAGGGQACNIFQERMNRELEPIIQRKDTDYGSNHVRNLWSRNIIDIYELKAEMRQGVGLAKRSGRHKAPHQKPKVKILLQHYNDNELNLRRPGRTYGGEREPDNFTKGIQKLRGGTLTQWARKTTRDRGIHVPAAETSEERNSDSEESDDDEVPDMTLGLIHAFDGEVVVDLEPDGDNVDGVEFEDYYTE